MTPAGLLELLGCEPVEAWPEGPPARVPVESPAELTEAQARACMLPLVLDDGEVTVCSALSGRADQAANMPRRLTLTRWHADGTRTNADYEIAPVVFEDSPKRLNAAEAVFGFAAWLTSRSEAVTWSENHGAESAAELAAAFVEANGLPPLRNDYNRTLSYPEETKKCPDDAPDSQPTP